MVRGWDRLPSEVVGAPCLSEFRRHLDSALRNVPELLVPPEGVRRSDSMSPKVLPTEQLHLTEAGEFRLSDERSASVLLEKLRGYSCSDSCWGNNECLRKQIQRF